MQSSAHNATHLKTIRNTYNLRNQNDETLCLYCLKKRIECMFNFSALENKRCALCSVFDRKMTNCSNSDVAFVAMKKIIQSKKKTIKSMIKSIKKIIKTVFLIFEIFFFAFENSVAASEFSNSMMFDALKRFDFSFVDFNKRQILSTFVVFSFFFFIETKHRLKLRFCLSNWFASTKISRNLRKKCTRKFLISRKK